LKTFDWKDILRGKKKAEKLKRKAKPKPSIKIKVGGEYKK
tara:strand:- start:290 stop:409 length:120 start_codon:yes stop_codon:yes gene_type:complete